MFHLPEKRRIYILCPVRKATGELKETLLDHVAALEANGHSVHYPPRDVDQSDPSGINIMNSHADVMFNLDEVQAWWDPTSEGSVCDLGMKIMRDRTRPLPISLIPGCVVERTEKKSYTNVVLDYIEMYRKQGFVPAQPKRP